MWRLISLMCLLLIVSYVLASVGELKGCTGRYPENWPCRRVCGGVQGYCLRGVCGQRCVGRCPGYLSWRSVGGGVQGYCLRGACGHVWVRMCAWRGVREGVRTVLVCGVGVDVCVGGLKECVLGWRVWVWKAGWKV